MLSKERKQAKKVKKQDLQLSDETKDFLNAWPKGAIVEVENISKNLYWRK